MVLKPRRHAGVLEELQEWLEDVGGAGIGSRVILLAVPVGWGRSAVLARFRDSVDDLDGPAAALVVIDGCRPGDRAVQAGAVQEALAEVPRSRATGVLERGTGVLDLDTGGGKAAMGLEVAALFVPGLGGLAGGLAVMLGSRLLSAAGRATEDGPSGEAGAVARAARAVAAVSVRLPVVVVIDDADQLDGGLARAMITGLAGRHDGRVLVVAAASPGSELVTSLVRDPGPELAGRVRKADAEPQMDYAARADLVREMLPGLPGEAVERIARRTATFGEVFAVAGADKVAELGPGASAGEAVAAADAVVTAVLVRAAPSREAAVLAWAGGALHERQAQACLGVLGVDGVPGDDHVRRAGALACLADRLSPRWADQAAAFSARHRAEMAAAVLAAVGKVAADPGAGLADRVVARHAVHRVRSDLDPTLRDQLPAVQCGLVRGLEALGDLEVARHVAREAITETAAGAGRRDLLMAYLRLARPAPGSTDPVAAEAISEAMAAGAAIGLEARVWAAADLLARDGGRAQAVVLAGQAAAELGARTDLGEAGDQWRLLLAFHAGKAGLPSLAQQLLGPLLASGAASREKPALAVLHAIDGPHADIRLQVIVLQAELSATAATAEEDQLRLHAALATAYNDLGIYPQALAHGHSELALRQRLQHPDHPSTLGIRGNIAAWTARCGDMTTALRLATEMLPDEERILGSDHPSVLGTRNNIAGFTGECGDAPTALRLFTALLPDQERILGPDDLHTLATRSNIAFWTGKCGKVATALRLATALVPDQERVLGPDDIHTLLTRMNVATMTEECGDAPTALRLATELLPDLERALGADHPDTLRTRSNVARLTAVCGDAPAALRLATELLPDQERALGADHPDTLTTRNNIAAYTAECGDVAIARRLLTALLADQERILGPDYPDNLRLRKSIAALTARSELDRITDDPAAVGDTPALTSQCQKIVAMAEEAYGSRGIRLVAYLRGAASVLAAAGQDAQAIKELSRAVAINDLYGAETAEAAADLRNLAELQRRNGLGQEAQQNLDLARDISERHRESSG